MSGVQEGDAGGGEGGKRDWLRGEVIVHTLPQKSDEQ